MKSMVVLFYFFEGVLPTARCHTGFQWESAGTSRTDRYPAQSRPEITGLEFTT